jgi:hypothetical protein
MKRLTMVAVSLIYVLSLFAVPAFAARATVSSADGTPKHLVPESSRAALTDVQLEQANRLGGKLGTASSQTSLGFMASPGLMIGSTGYDIQHNSRMGRQIVQGPNGRVHFVWTHKLAGAASTLRQIRYQTYVPGSGFSELPGGLEISDAREGHMCAIDHFNNSALPVWRYGAAFASYRSTSALDFASGAASFTIVDLPSATQTCEGIFSGPIGEPYIWPVVAADVDGSNNPIAHVVAMEGNSDASYSSMAYFRGTGGTFTSYGTCGRFIDSTTAISYTVAQDPGSDKVAIAYTKARTAASSRENNDLCYRMSTDLGVTWGSVVNVSQYNTADKERASQETSSMFDADGCYHILYVAAFYDSAANQVADQAAKLYHWDDCNDCRSLVLDANNEDPNCNMKAFEHNVARISLSECTVAATKTLYAVYTRYVGDEDPTTPALKDCSAGQVPNGEIYASASSTGGETWGPPINLTNSRTDNCASGACDDDNFGSSAMYVTDSLRIQYLNDKDAGSGVGNDGTAETYSPVMFLSHGCFPMDTYRFLTATPSGLTYPILHAAPTMQANTTLTLTNAGNATANWTNVITYNIGSGWLNLSAAGAVTAGCTNSQTLNVTAGPIANEGYYSATITFTYQGPTMFNVPVEFYVFTNFFLPQDAALRTELVRMNVNQAGRNSHQEPGKMFYFFNEETEPIFDGSLILGNSATNLSWLLFEGGGSNPTVSNPFGFLYASSNTTHDSTGSALYRTASGSGTNRDTTLEFDVTYYAPKDVDYSKFIIATYNIHKGANDSLGTVSGLTIAYGLDIDVPDDSSQNRGGSDASRQAVYQRGVYNGADLYYAGMRGVRYDNTAIVGGFNWENDVTVYPLGGYENDSLWNKLVAVNGYVSTDSSEDLNSVLTIAKNVTINGATNDEFEFAVAFAANDGSAKSLASFQEVLDSAKSWLCQHVYTGAPACADCKCGDADGNGIFTISDAVYLINFIFAGGPAPDPLCEGDADGNGIITISDAVYLINFIFAGGPTPHCP